MVDDSLTETMSPQTHVARGATFMFIQGFLNAALGVIYVWFLLHTSEITGQMLFTDLDFGFFTLLSFITSLASTLGILALTSASVRYIAQYIAEGKEAEAKSVVTSVLRVSAATSLTIAILLLTLSGILSNIFTDSNGLIFILLPVVSMIQTFYSQTLGFLQGMQKLRELSMVSVLYTTLQYSVAILLVYAGFGVLGIVISWIFGFAIAWAVAISITFHHMGFSTNAHSLKPLLVFSFPLYISALLSIVVNWVDQIFVFPFLGIDALGVYSIAVRASVVPNLVSTAIIFSLFPKLSELHSTSGISSLRDAFRTSTRYAALLGFPVALMVATLAYPIIVLFATVKFVDATIPLAVMCIAALPAILGSAISPTLLTLKRTKTVALITVIAIFLEASLSYVSLAYLKTGLVGVAFSRFFAAFTGFILGVYVLRASLKIGFDKEAVWKSAVASVAMVLSLFGLELLRSIVEPSSYQFLVLRLRLLPLYAVAGVLVYLLTLIALRTVKRKDIELLREYLPKHLRRIASLLSRVARIKE
jgi:O-antigen/teichoic acid export membrane protein